MTAAATYIPCRCERCSAKGTSETFFPHTYGRGATRITRWYCPTCSPIVDRQRPVRIPSAALLRARKRKQ